MQQTKMFRVSVSKPEESLCLLLCILAQLFVLIINYSSAECDRNPDSTRDVTPWSVENAGGVVSLPPLKCFEEGPWWLSSL